LPNAELFANRIQSKPATEGAAVHRRSRFSFKLFGRACTLRWGSGTKMILPALTAIPLLILAAATPNNDLARHPAHLSSEQRTAAVQPFINRATECVARTVAANPRSSDTSQLGNLIVDSMPPCADDMRAMIDTYDNYFGDGAGEAFFAGPYLDVLPTAISTWVAQHKR
jgi:hypothetical protein